MARGDPSALRRSTGLEACAFVLAHAVDVVAIVGGEGSRRLARALLTVRDARAIVLPEHGFEAASIALGAACATRRVALVVSGREAACAAVPVLREMARLGLSALVVVPSHGDEMGRSVPHGPYDDLAALFDAPVGIVVASTVREVADLGMAACTLASVTATPWCVAFELARVGCALGAFERPSRDEVSASWCDPAPPGDIDAAWERVRARRPELGPVTRVRSAGGRVSLRLGGSDFDSASGVRVYQLRPFPRRHVASACEGADEVVVAEPFPDPLMPDDGRLTAWLRSALTGSSARIGSITEGLHDSSAGSLRVELAWNEPARGAIVREALRWIASQGLPVRAWQHEPWAATIDLRLPDGVGLAHETVVVCESGALGLGSVIEAQPAGTLVLLLGLCESAALDELREACGRRSVTLLHEPEAGLEA